MGGNGCIQKISCVFKGNGENYLQAKQRVANSEKLLTNTVCSLWRIDLLWSRPSQKAPIWFFTANNRAHWSRFQQKEHLLNDIGTSTFRKVELMYFFLFLPLSTNKNHRHYVYNNHLHLKTLYNYQLNLQYRNYVHLRTQDFVESL